MPAFRSSGVQVIANLVNFLLSLVILVAFLLITRVTGQHVLALPAIVLGG